jgi:general secretion pathway protein J
MTRSHDSSGEAGFTLIEAMAAVAVMAVIVGALSTVAGQWLPHWGRGLSELQRADLLDFGIDRIAADVAAAKYVSLTGDEEPLFDGTVSSVTFLRSAIGPDSASGLETVRISQVPNGTSFAMVRAKARFTPSLAGASLVVLADPVVLVRAPVHIFFAYAGPDRVWSDTWEGQKRLPDAIRITALDASGHVLGASTAIPLRVTAPAQDKSKIGADTRTAAPSTVAVQRP